MREIFSPKYDIGCTRILCKIWQYFCMFHVQMGSWVLGKEMEFNINIILTFILAFMLMLYSLVKCMPDIILFPSYILIKTNQGQKRKFLIFLSLRCLQQEYPGGIYIRKCLYSLTVFSSRCNTGTFRYNPATPTCRKE